MPARSLWERLQEDGEIRLNSPIELMRFTLVYEGDLKVQTKGDCRKELKHDIRAAFHKQLAELWNERIPLRRALAYYRKWSRIPDHFAHEPVYQSNPVLYVPPE